MPLIDAILEELEVEAHTTRRVLERVPGDRLDWRPGPKARTLGGLAKHVAIVPGAVAELVTAPSPVQAPDFSVPDPGPGSASELLPMLDDSIARARKALRTLDDAALHETWRMLKGERELFAVPRLAFVRSTVLNHWYHHRGQLTVYLRALGVPVPSVYGPSADENPFG
jgi:uncharacterized damage-inducible protein DinB